MRQRLLDILKGLEETIPPPEGMHHSICLSCISRSADGSAAIVHGADAIGAPRELGLHVVWHGKFRTFFLDDSDFNMPLEVFLDEVQTRLAFLD